MRASLVLTMPTMLTALLLLACSASHDVQENPPPLVDSSVGEVLDARDDSTGFDALLDSPDAPCKGLQCKQVKCDGGVTTTLSGVAYAPNGTLPLYNVIAYIPNATPDPMPKGVTCDRCGVVASGEPLVTALSDYRGRFKLENVPVGKDIPLVIQLGKWRRQVTIPEILPCTDNSITDASKTRLPRKQSEGDMPRIAVTTGGCDKVACMLPKVGIDASEFGVSGGSKAVTFFSARGTPGPSGMKDAKALWNDYAELQKYDLAIFSCECDEAYGSWTPVTKDSASFDAVTKYLAAGGRIFTTDFQYTWYKYSPDTALAGIGDLSYDVREDIKPIQLDTTFPKGKALYDWLRFVDKSVTSTDIPFDAVFNHVHSVDKKVVQTWATDVHPDTGKVQPNIITVNTPVGKPAEAQCGKGVHLNVHVNGSDRIDATYPAGCTSALKTGEAVFAFFFFDLAACIQREADEPKPPPIK